MAASGHEGKSNDAGSRRGRKRRYLVCEFGEVLLCVADDVSHSEDRAVDVVDLVKVAAFDVIGSDGGKKVPSFPRQREY